MEDKPRQLQRPNEVALGAWAALAAAVLLVVSSYDSLSRLHTLATQEELRKTLDTASGRDLGLSIAQATSVMHVLLLVTGAGAAVAVVLSVFALQRHHAARAWLSALAVLLVVTSTAADPLLALVLAGGTAMLWSRRARDWFAGRAPQPSAPSGGLRDDEGAERAVWQQSEETPEPGRTGPDAPPVQNPPPPPTHQPAGPQGPSWRPPPPPPYAPQQQWPVAPPPPAFGAAPWPGAPYGAPQQRLSGPPGTVRTAAILTWVLSGLAGLLFAILGVVLLVDRGGFLDKLIEEFRATGRSVDLPRADLVTALGVGAVLFLVWSLVACVLAWFVWRGHGWARIVLVLSAAVALLVCFAGLFGSVANLVGAAVVIALLFTRSANDFFARRQGGSPPGHPIPGQHPGSHPGQFPGNYPGNYPGNHPGNHPGPPPPGSGNGGQDAPSGKPPVW